MVSERYSFFSPRYGPLSALRGFHARADVFEGALEWPDVLNVLRELATASRRGESSDLMALGKAAGELPSGRSSTDWLLDGLARAIDRGTLVLVQGWGTPGTITSSPVPDSGNERIVARAMGEARDLAFEGERYVVKTSASWRQSPDRLFQALHPDVARGVLARLAARSSWPKDQQAALAEVGANLADPTKPESLENGLVLLRRGSSGAAAAPAEESTVAVTPSQVKPKEEKKEEKVDPVMDGRKVDLDLEEVELPVEELAAGDPEPSPDGAAADAPEAGEEPEAPSDSSSDPEAP